jgi:hypothetical protein
LLDKLIAILGQLAPLATTLVPGAGAIPEIIIAVGALVKYIHDQSGMTTDEILAKALGTLDENEIALMKDKLELGG